MKLRQVFGSAVFPVVSLGEELAIIVERINEQAVADPEFIRGEGTSIGSAKFSQKREMKIEILDPQVVSPLDPPLTRQN